MMNQPATATHTEQTAFSEGKKKKCERYGGGGSEGGEEVVGVGRWKQASTVL